MSFSKESQSDDSDLIVLEKSTRTSRPLLHHRIQSFSLKIFSSFCTEKMIDESKEKETGKEFLILFVF